MNMAQPLSSSSPSLPREGDVVEGHYKILRGKGVEVEYEVLDVKTGEVSSKQYSLPNKDCYTLSHLPQCQYYQVDGIDVKYRRVGLKAASVKLVLLQEPQGEKVQGPRRTFKLEEKEKILEIRDALQRGDQDVYCSLINVWGVEVLGDIRSLPKDPPILRLPEEMMDMICSYLDERDRYSLRLVSPVIPQEYIPIHKLFKIWKLILDVDENKSGVEITPKKQVGTGGWQYFNRRLRLDLSNEAYQEFLGTTSYLDVYRSKRLDDEKLLSAVKNNCTNLDSITLTFPENVDRSLISQLASGNQETLGELIIDFEDLNATDCDIDLALMSGCKKLGAFLLECGRIVNLESLASFKNNLTHISLKHLKEPLRKDQLIWISKNLPKLNYLDVDVLHHCFDTKPGEVDDQTIVSILETNTSIDFELVIYFHSCTDGEKGAGRKSKSGRLKKYCSKASRLRKQVTRVLKDQGESSSESGWTSHLSNFKHESSCSSSGSKSPNIHYSELEFAWQEYHDFDYSKDSSEDEEDCN